MKRVLVLGVDGLSVPVWEYLSGAQLIPHLASIIHTASPLHSTTPPHSAPAWTSISTGLNPGRHGVLDFWQRTSHTDMDTSSRPLFTSSGKLSFWEVAHLGGARVGVFNYPLSYPPRDIGGFWVSGLNTPPNVQDWVLPRRLTGVLSGFLPEVDLIGDLSVSKPITDEQRSAQLNHITALLRNHLDTGLSLLSYTKDEGISLYVYILTSTDRFLHLFWDTLFEHSQAISHDLYKSVAEYWLTLDAGVSRWLDAIQPDTIVLTSDHGFTKYPSIAFNFDKWLRDRKVLSTRTSVMSATFYAQLVSRATRVKSAVRQRLPESIQKRVRQTLRNEANRAYRSSATLVPELLYGSTLALDINPRLQNRVTGDAIDRIFAEIRGEADGLNNEHGKAIIRSVKRGGDIWWGQYLDTYPKYVIRLDSQYGGAVGSADPRLFIPVRSLRTGDHDLFGMIGFNERYETSVEPNSTPHVWDVPAIALYLLGAGIPNYFDGKVPDWLPGKPQYTDEVSDPEAPSREYTQQEALAIEKRLRGLGYLE